MRSPPLSRSAIGLAPSGHYEIQAVRAGHPIEIDGVLSDEAWRNAPMIDSFTQQEPENGQPATEAEKILRSFQETLFEYRKYLAMLQNLQRRGL